MGSNADLEPNSTPKLSYTYFSLPSQSPEPPGMLTPPLRPPASIPFNWEEAPGKPRTGSTTFNSRTSRCLELPPRLVLPELTKTSSPTAVLQGPYVSRSSSYSISFSRERRKHSSFGSPERSGRAITGQSKERGSFRAWVRRGLQGNRRVAEDSSPSSSSSSSAPSCSVSSSPCVCDSSGNTKVKITRFTRSGSLSILTLSNNKSHLWASIKQVVPVAWRSRKMKKDDGPIS